jgi:hypothetical protein
MQHESSGPPFRALEARKEIQGGLNLFLNYLNYSNISQPVFCANIFIAGLIRGL